MVLLTHTLPLPCSSVRISGVGEVGGGQVGGGQEGGGPVGGGQGGGGQGGTTPHPQPFGSNEGAGPQQLGSKKVIVKQKSSYKALSLINICCLY